MSWYEWGFEYNECTCKFCGESSEEEFCNKECQIQIDITMFSMSTVFTIFFKFGGIRWPYYDAINIKDFLGVCLLNLF